MMSKTLQGNIPIKSTINSSNLPLFFHTNKNNIVNNSYPFFCFNLKPKYLPLCFNLFPRLTRQYSNSFTSNWFRSSRKLSNFQAFSVNSFKVSGFSWKFQSFSGISEGRSCRFIFVCSWFFFPEFEGFSNRHPVVKIKRFSSHLLPAFSLLLDQIKAHTY